MYAHSVQQPDDSSGSELAYLLKVAPLRSNERDVLAALHELEPSSLFGQLVKKRRISLERTQQDLADSCETINRHAIARWETTTSIPSLSGEQLAELAEALEMEVHVLHFALERSRMLKLTVNKVDEERDLGIVLGQLGLTLAALHLSPRTRNQRAALDSVDSAIRAYYHSLFEDQTCGGVVDQSTFASAVMDDRQVSSSLPTEKDANEPEREVASHRSV